MRYITLPISCDKHLATIDCPGAFPHFFSFICRLILHAIHFLHYGHHFVEDWNLWYGNFRGQNVPLCENRPELPRSVYDTDGKKCSVASSTVQQNAMRISRQISIPFGSSSTRNSADIQPGAAPGRSVGLSAVHHQSTTTTYQIAPSTSGLSCCSVLQLPLCIA